MSQQSEQQQLLRAIIDKELQEIDEEIATLDNSDISDVVAFHIKHGIRDVEARIEANEPTELECPYGTSEELKESMNQQLLDLEALLQYYYRACYFGTDQERKSYRQHITAQIEI